MFTNALDGGNRPFVVAFSGVKHGRTFNLAEHIRYEDGARELKIWHITKTGPGTYVGRRKDVVGTAIIRQVGPVLRLSYDVLLGQGPKPTQVHFEDVIEKLQNGSVVNRAVVSKFGLPFGKVVLHFSRHPLGYPR